MGLASALNTALTGMTGAETTIDVVGNNLANSNTVGFKASQAEFATQFLQTQSLGSSPTDGSGGTNPRQIGLGSMVADITPNFNQGTVEISSNSTDMAIQGDGFFMMQGGTGETLYTRNGVLKLNAESQLVGTTGDRLLGFGVDGQFQLQSTSLVPLSIPLGKAAVAQATKNVYLEGTLSPTGDLGATSQIIQTGVLGNAQYSAPITYASLATAVPPALTNVTLTAGSAGALDAGNYYYKLVYADRPLGTVNDTEGVATTATSQVAVGANGSVSLAGLPSDSGFSYVRAYRTQKDAAATDPYYLVGETPMQVNGTFLDTKSDAQISTGASAKTLDTAAIKGNYTYYVTFAKAGSTLESHPMLASAAGSIAVDGRVHFTNLPTYSPAQGNQWDTRRIYRNLSNDPSHFYLVSEDGNINDASVTFTDSKADGVISSSAPAVNPLYKALDFDGPKISNETLLKNVIRRTGETTYENVFAANGTLQFTGNKDGRSLTTKSFAITNTSTVSDLMNFMEQALGIQKPPGSDSSHPIPSSTNPTSGGPALSPGISVVDGHIEVVSDTGTGNAVDIGLSGMQLKAASGQTSVNMPFSNVQTAKGESATTDFVAYDSLGIPLSVRITTVLESRTSAATTYRWYADSGDNDPLTGAQIAVGTGLLTFDGLGNFVSSTQETVSIDRRHVSSASPLEFQLDFSQLSGLAVDKSSLAVSRQDGSGPGTLTSFTVGQDGRIHGVFSNGVTRNLGQIRLARFSNPAGLEQRGENMFAAGINSGLPVEANPGEQGTGSVISGAVELSNTDIGSSLIELITASTMYRGNARVITTVQQMLDELLALKR